MNYKELICKKKVSQLDYDDFVWFTDAVKNNQKNRTLRNASLEDGELIYIIRKRYNAGETRNIAIARVTKTVVKTAGKTAIKEAGKKTIKELIPDAKTVKKWV